MPAPTPATYSYPYPPLLSPTNCLAHKTSGGKLPLLTGRAAVDGQTTIQECRNQACQLLVQEVAARRQL